MSSYDKEIPKLFIYIYIKFRVELFALFIKRFGRVWLVHLPRDDGESLESLDDSKDVKVREVSVGSETSAFMSSYVCPWVRVTVRSLIRRRKWLNSYRLCWRKTLNNKKKTKQVSFFRWYFHENYY